MHLFGELSNSLPPNHSGSATLVYFFPLHLASMSPVGADLNYPVYLSLQSTSNVLTGVHVASGSVPYVQALQTFPEVHHFDSVPTHLWVHEHSKYS